MTESEWLSCREVDPMLAFLMDRAGDRKLRLFEAGCCRQIWRYLRHEACQRAVEVAEAFAYGECDSKSLQKTLREARRVYNDLEFEAPLKMSLKTWAMKDAARASVLACEARVVPSQVASVARQAMAASTAPSHDQCAILRCLFGPLPFRPIAIESDWLGSNGGVVATLARSIDEGRSFDRMPYLADALEEVGCTDVDLLAHCRSRCEHHRGCWAIDLLLGKES